MKVIEQKTRELIDCIKDSRYYKTYEESLGKITNKPEIRSRVDEYRARTFRLFNDTNGVDLFEETDRIEKEHRELRKIPEVNEFLDAEIELCRLLKEMEARIGAALDVQIPEV